MSVELSLLLIALILSALRHAKSEEWCEKKWVGWMRRSLGPILPPNVRPIGADREKPRVREQAAEFLADHCRQCVGCELGKKQVMG